MQQAMEAYYQSFCTDRVRQAKIARDLKANEASELARALNA